MENNKQYILTTPFDTFKSDLEKLISEAGQLHKTTVNTEDELTALKAATKDWTDRSLAVLQNSFNEPDNSYATDFRYANPSFYHISGTKKTLKQLVDKQKETIATKQKSLWDNLRILTVSDAIVAPDKIDKTQRERYTVDEKLSLLLDKLYELYDDYYYPVREILEGNAIKLKRYDDDRELAGMLENRGFVKLLGGMGQGINAQLSAEGAMYVENNRRPIKENYEDIRQTPEELENKINEIIERLTVLGYGQEIIFDELQELKDLYTKLSKKTWGQVLKGKLIDLSLGKVVENDTIKYIYETLTDHQLQLP